MKTLTKDTFNESLIGKSLVMFYRSKGCGNCDKVHPIFEKISKDNLKTFDIEIDTEGKDIIGSYVPKNTNWQLPLIVYLEDGEIIDSITGNVDKETILNTTKTIQNVSDKELEQAEIDLQIRKAALRKDVFNVETALKEIQLEQERRKNN